MRHWITSMDIASLVSTESIMSLRVSDIEQKKFHLNNAKRLVTDLDRTVEHFEQYTLHYQDPSTTDPKYVRIQFILSAIRAAKEKAYLELNAASGQGVLLV